jgi:hypothetical protein
MIEKKIYETRKLILAELTETIGNPQSMTDSEFKGLVDSIKKKGFILDDPVVWEYEPKKFRIISGHHRIKAAIEAGYIELNCKIISGISDKVARLLVLEANNRRGNIDNLKLERYIQDVLSDFEIGMDEINNEIGNIIKNSILENEIYADLQKESESLKLTICFKSFEEKEKFVEILDYYGGRGRSITDKIKNFVGIILRDQKKKDEKNDSPEQ